MHEIYESSPDAAPIEKLVAVATAPVWIPMVVAMETVNLFGWLAEKVGNA